MIDPEQIIPILIGVAVVLIVIIVILVIVWFTIISKQRHKKDDEPEENQENKKKNVYKTYDIKSIMDFIDFEKVEDNMIIEKGGKYLMAIECQGINYDLMSEMERVSVEQGFIEFLNTLKSEIQIYVQTRTVNLEESLQDYRIKFRDIEDKYSVLQNKYMQMKDAEPGVYTNKQIYDAYTEYLRQKNKYEYTKDIIADTEKSSLNSNVLHKKYYIIIAAYENEVNSTNYSKDEIQNLVFSELYTRAKSIMRTLARCEVNSKILDSVGLIELLYNAYNREDSDIFSARQALKSGYEEFYSTSTDVFDKKMKLLNQQIEEQALATANQAIFEARSDKEMMYQLREENAKNLIFDFAEQLISENEDYIGRDIAESAKAKIETSRENTKEGGEQDEQKKKTTTRGRKSRSNQQ